MLHNMPARSGPVRLFLDALTCNGTETSGDVAVSVWRMRSSAARLKRGAEDARVTYRSHVREAGWSIGKSVCLCVCVCVFLGNID